MKNNNNNKSVVAAIKETETDRNEILFYKVFNNVFLFNKIINYIEVCEWNKLDGFKQIECTNKFKYITSLEWILENKQYSLLKCKLEANDDIDITKNSIEMLLTVTDGSAMDINEKQLDYHDNGSSGNNFNTKMGESNRLLQLFQLLLKHKLNQITTQFDIYEMIIIADNLDAFKILNMDIYNYKIKTIHLEFIIENSNKNFFNYVLNTLNIYNNNCKNKYYNNNNNNLITDKFKNNSIFKAFYNKKHRDEMLEYILNNYYLYNKPSSSSSTTTTTIESNKKLKLSNISTEVSKLESYSILYIKSCKLKSRLLKLHYFKEINVELINSIFKDKPKFEIQLIIDNLNQTFSNGGGCGDYGFTINQHSFKEIYENTFFDITWNYLLKYDIPLVGMNLDLVYLYGLHSFSCNSFQFLMNLKEKDNSKFKELIYDRSFSFKADVPINEITKFLKLYTSQQYQYFQSSNFDSHFRKYLLSINSKDNYEQLVNSISTNYWSKNLLSLPKTWNPSIQILQSKEKLIDDKETVDWLISENIFGNFDKSTCYQTRNILKLFDFENIQVIEYVFEKLSLFFSMIPDNSNSEIKLKCFNFVFRKAIVYCDIGLLLKIEQSIPNLKFNEGELIIGKLDTKQRKIIQFDSGLSTDGIINLFNHLFSNGYNIIGDFIFSCLVHMLILKLNGNKQSYIPWIGEPEPTYTPIGFNYHCSIDGKVEGVQDDTLIEKDRKILLSNALTIDFELFKTTSIELFVKYTSCISTIAIRLFFSKNFNPMKSHPNLFFKLWSTHTQYQLDESVRYDDNNYYTPGRRDRSRIYCFQHQILYHPSYNSEFKGIFYNTSNESVDLIIELMELILSQFKIDNDSKESEINCNSGDDIISYFNVVENVLNLLYKRIIRSKFATVEKVKYIRNILINSSLPFKFQHSIFHSFYYILLKSPRLLIFIIRLQSLTNLNHHMLGYIVKEKALKGKSPHIKFDFIGFLNENYFTFQYLHGDDYNNDQNEIGTNYPSFNQILSDLINQLVHSYAIKYPNTVDYNTSLNKTLEYLLEIRNYELFKQQIEYIKQLLDDENLIISNFPTIITQNSLTTTLQQPQQTTRIFKFSVDLFKMAIKILDPESFNLFIQFCSYESVRDCFIATFGDNTIGLENKYISIHSQSIDYLFNYFNIKKINKN